MHLHRLVVIAGVIIGIIGLFFSGLKTVGQVALPLLSQQNESLPDGIPTIWGGLAAWAQIVLVILIVVVVVLALMPDRAQTYSRGVALETSVIGVALLAYAIVRYADATDSAEDLEAVFAAAAAAGTRGVAAWEVSPTVGFFVLILGTVLVIIGGVMSLIASSE